MLFFSAKDDAGQYQQHHANAEENKSIDGPHMREDLLCHGVAEEVVGNKGVEHRTTDIRLTVVNKIIRTGEHNVDEQAHSDGSVTVSGQHTEEEHQRSEEKHGHECGNCHIHLVILGDVNGNADFVCSRIGGILIRKDISKHGHHSVEENDEKLAEEHPPCAYTADQGKLDFVGVVVHEGNGEKQKNRCHHFREIDEPELGERNDQRLGDPYVGGKQQECGADEYVVDGVAE